ncbi:MAG: hypothetical protein JXR95_04735 [Deltaproteobacteria bacterium]|nr:hypothetical protein [Deltaproteobacteria bacterium]
MKSHPPDKNTPEREKPAPSAAELQKLAATLEMLQEVWIHTQQMAMIISFIGLVLAAMLGGAGYLVSNKIARLLHMSGAMGCLVGSAVGINVIDRVRKKGKIPWFGVLIFLGVVISGLLATHIKAREFGVTTLWPPLAGAAFASVMAGVIWRLRASSREFEKLKNLVSELES